MERIKVKPASGIFVLDPETKRPIAPEGVMVMPSTYWRRRLKEGSVLIVVDEKKKEKQSEPIKSGGNK